METALQSNAPAWLQLLVHQQHLVLLLAIFGGMLLLMLFERPRPGEAADQPLPLAHWFNNWILATLNYGAGLWLVLALGNLAWVSGLRPQWSLFASLHPALALPLLFFILEAVAYGLHRLYHRVPLLWRVHAVHHMDRQLDVTTSHRHHTLEVLFFSLLSLPLFLLLGAPPILLVLLALLRTGLVLWNHASVRVPEGLERWLRFIVVTPAFHHVHHLDDPRYTNSNYGTAVPWFDYVFGTARTLAPAQLAEQRVGLEYLDGPGDERLDRILLLPLLWHRYVVTPPAAPESPAPSAATASTPPVAQG